MCPVRGFHDNHVLRLGPEDPRSSAGLRADLTNYVYHRAFACFLDAIACSSYQNHLTNAFEPRF